ncbi:small membrane protein [Klebsiella aerogenes]|nr:small membrane protein [Klebsiella aerogenes]EIV6182403.1 small membrane protein [Klebsiella aerogenes]EIW8606882.1 small membrane protein [Klebsiella aerogenes]EKW3882691.1 small membrane protein [Klebsiella aerogenes]EKZ6375873.1 small membrane protein [Klebsiella aerogenes]ELA2524119.1 small membrane protein [Klebsiella aerogenes]
MGNLFFLVITAILLAVAIFYLISYIKDRRTNILTFTRKK